MDEKKNVTPKEEKKAVAPPPLVNKKVSAPPVVKEEAKTDATPVKPQTTDNSPKKKLVIIIPIACAVLVVLGVVGGIVFKNLKDKQKETTDPGIFVVTDENGVAVTDENGVPMTYVAETEYVNVTDANGSIVTDADGNNVTTAVYKEHEITLNVKVTNEKGEQVTNSKGENVTKQEIIKQDPNKADGDKVVLGTTAVAVTDGQGNTAVDNAGNVFTTIVEITSNPVAVEPAAIDWKASLGGTAEDYFSSIETDKDGNYIAANVTNSKDGQFKEFESLGYAAPYTVLVKYDKSGNIKWQKAIGHRRGTLQIMDILTNDDGTFYAVGYGKNVGGVNGRGYYDGAVFKFDKDGNEIWHKVFGSSTVDLFNGGTKTSDGGIVAVGTVGNNDYDAKGFGKNELESAACIVKYDSEGNLVWKNIIGGNKDYFNGVVEGTDGNIFAVGNFYSGEVFEGLGSSDGGVVKFNSSGKFVGVAPISGRGIESFKGITACKNGGVVVVGKSNSSDSGNVDSAFVGDVASRGGDDAYIIKYDSDLNREFIKPFRGQYDDDLVAVVEKEDGTYIAVGKSNSSSRDLKGITTRGGDDMVIASFDKYGNLAWARSFGGTQNESANAICLAEKEGYIIAGRTLSKDIDMKGISQYVNGRSVGVIAKFPE
ncbi:MAG: hypothetical protein IKT55_04235 [Clostridia bacterium]|nr:hypothetical protein [Clostridia bacterium]